ncbi:membrane protein [Arthrobacter phage Atuin]|nr:membrane protein [Arthrobacter phage Atuin]
MSTFIVFAIVLFGLAAIGGVTYYKVKKYGRQILPWTKEAKTIRAMKREWELQNAVRKVIDGQKKEWDDQFGA